MGEKADGLEKQFEIEDEAAKLKILVWDFKKDAMQWIDNNICINKICIVKNLTDIDEMLDKTAKCQWEYIFCNIPAGQNALKEKFKSIFRQLGIGEEKIVFISDLDEWVKQKELAFYLLKGDLKKRMELYCEKSKKDFVTCTVDGISYIMSSGDKVILDWMYMYERNWADTEMEAFYSLAKKYYQTDPSQAGYFLDIGANIGTTCVYFKKKLDSNVTILAFEPEINNYKLLSTNLLLNDLAKTSICENYGLSDQQEQRTLHINKANPGQDSILLDYGQEKEEIQMVSLDEYLLQKDISPSDIKYIWIDTEGFEPIVLSGARNTLRDGNIPVFMEFNPYLWNSAGLFEKMMEVLSEIYTKYIIIDEALEENETLHSIDELWQYKDAPRFLQHDLFLIKG